MPKRKYPGVLVQTIIDEDTATWLVRQSYGEGVSKSQWLRSLIIDRKNRESVKANDLERRVTHLEEELTAILKSKRIK